MSRVFVDDDLLTWEAYASTGRFGLAERPRIVFHCLSDPGVRARFVIHSGDEANAEETVHQVPEDHLKQMLKESQALE